MNIRQLQNRSDQSGRQGQLTMANTTNVTLESMPDTVVTGTGAGYMTTALLIIPLHIICSWLMWSDKDMRNPTYQFIINLSIADVLELIVIGLYAGSIILFRMPYNPNTYFARFMSWWCLSLWYINGVLFALIAFSRWIAMTRSHLVKTVFTKQRLRVMHIAPWAIILGFYSYAVCLFPHPTFILYPDLFTWGFDMAVPFAEFLHWFNFSFNTCCTLSEMIFNIMSLHWVRKTRKTIQTLASSENRRREVKLLVQCFIIGCVYTMTHVMFTIVGVAGLASPVWFMSMQIMWTLNHCVNPIVYLCVNTKLRLALIRFMTRGKFGHHTVKRHVTIPTMGIFPGSGHATINTPAKNQVAPDVNVNRLNPVNDNVND